MIEIYGTPSCSKCNMVKKILDQKGTEYEFIESFTKQNREFPIIYIDEKEYTYEEFLKLRTEGLLK
jgi:arsenate reductase-like glutaredoxin family protein